MKKALIPLCGLLAAASAAAQSNVTLFGVADVSLSHGSGSTASRTQMLRGGLTANRLGFRGTEDLGGGLSAAFWLETGMNPDDGSGQATNTNNQPSGGAVAGIGGGQGLTFNRRATVSLAGGWGELRVGRDYVPQYWNLAFADPFGNVGVGTAMNYAAIVTGVVSTRASNTVAYLTPGNLGGFGLQVMQYFGENASNAANSRDGTGQGLRVWYDQGPLALALGYGRTRYATGNVTQGNLLGSYNFGVAKLLLGYSRDAAGALDGRGGVVGAVVPLAPGEVHAAYSWYRTDAVGRPEARKLAIGYAYNLSKRTALYATYAHVRNSGGSAQALNGAVTGANASSNGFDLGIRHSF